jgi:hypothetical protein
VTRKFVDFSNLDDHKGTSHPGYSFYKVRCGNTGVGERVEVIDKFLEDGRILCDANKNLLVLEPVDINEVNTTE